MWPALVVRVGRSNSYEDNNLFGGPLSFPITICVDNVFTLSQDALGVK